MHYKVGAIVQARIDSTRLPGKVVLPILGMPMLSLLLYRIKKAKLVDRVIVATSNEKSDDPISELVNNEKDIILYRGDKKDVLIRMFMAAKENNLSHILRVTADNPFFDWEIADQLINMISNNIYDYVSNNLVRSFPYGIDLEVITYNALKIASNEATSDFDHEHVTPFIRNNNKRFRLGNLQNCVNLSNDRLTVDNITDYEFVSSLFERFGSDITFRDIPKS